MKHKQAIKQLIKSAILCVLAVVVCAVIYYFTSEYRTGVEQSIQEKNGQLMAIRGNYNMIEKRVNEVNQAYEFYVEFQKSDSSKAESFRRDNANKILAKLGEEAGVDQIFLAMGQFREVGGKYKKDSVGLYSTDMAVQFLSFTDSAVFNLIKRIQNRFPGSVKIQSFSIKREQFEEKTLVDLSEENKKGLVAGDITFVWSGIQEIDKSQTAKPQNAKQPAAPQNSPGPGYNRPQPLPEDGVNNATP